MKRVKAEILVPGMVFSDAVFLDETTMLAAKGIPLTQKDIDSLRKWKISEVLTNGHLVQARMKQGSGPENAVPPQRASESRSEQRRRLPDLPSRYAALAGEMNSFLSKIRNQEDLTPLVIDRIVDSLFSLVKGSSEEIARFVLSSEKSAVTQAENALNTSLISLLIGVNMKLPTNGLVQLTTGSVLHDIGMMLLPDSILNKKGDLREEEYRRMQEHPVQSHRLITKILKYPEEVGLVALHHHERWDGKGYPGGLKGEEINLHARIVTVADTFDAMVSNRPYRDPMSGYMAMKSILNENSRKFDPSILKLFIRTFGIYPVGSIVLLSDSRVGRVIRIHPESPIRPRLRILDGIQDIEDAGEKNLVDLGEEKHLFIVRAINPSEILREGETK